MVYVTKNHATLKGLNKIGWFVEIMSDFKFSLISPEKKIYEGEITSIIAPGLEGYFGVLAHHAPLLAVLGAGKVILRKDKKFLNFRISGGFFEVQNNEANLLADSIEPQDLTISF